MGAFTIQWTNLLAYIFPPFNSIGKVLNKIIRDLVEKAILIFPRWPTQSWFPGLLDCLCPFPTRIPRHWDVLTLPHSGQAHPVAKLLQLY